MFRSSHRHVTKNSVPRRSRFAPRLEALESRYAPACSFNPSNGVLYGGAGDTVLLYYVPASDGQDIYCNFQYIGTSFSHLYFYTEPQSTFLEIDTTLSASAGNYYVDYDEAQFGNGIYFMNWKPANVAFILGNAANTVSIGDGPPNVTVVGWSQSQPAKVEYYESTGTLDYLITQNEIHPYGLTGDIDLYNVNEISFHGRDDYGSNIIVKHTAGSLGTMPLIYIDGNGGTDTLTIDASAHSTPEKYRFDEERFSMPDYFKNVVWYRDTENITLKAGSGIDEITLRNSSGNLVGLPRITVNGGDGVDTLIADHSSYYEGTYYLTELGMAWAGLGDVFYYQGVEKVTFKTGVGDDHILIGSNLGQLAWIPDIDVQAGTGGTNFLYFTDSANTYPQTYKFTENELWMPQSLGLVATFSNVDVINLYSGSGTNVVNLKPTTGSLLSMLRYFGIHGGSGSDTINIHDQQNPNATTYVASSSSPGTGAVTIPGTNFGAYFDSTNEVNLYRSLALGSTVNKNGYNPGHYVLNVLPANDDMSGAPPDEDPADPPVQPPMPAPPGPNDDEKPLVRRKVATMPVGRHSAAWKPDADEWFADTLQLQRS